MYQERSWDLLTEDRRSAVTKLEALNIGPISDPSWDFRSCCFQNLLMLQGILVGARGFEPRTPCAQGRCATRLRYAPTDLIINDAMRVTFGVDPDFETTS